MKTKHTLCMAGCLLMTSLMCIGIAAQTRQDGPGELDERLAAPLRNAGIAINEASLIQALSNNDLLIASRAAWLLRRFPKSTRMVRALNSSVKDPREVVAVTAAQSLLRLKETEWVSVAIKRLPEMKDRVSQIQLAGLLAEAGRTEGWQIISSAVLDTTLYSVALDYVSFFDQKTGPNGKTINVVEELEKIRNVAPEQIRKDIDVKIRELKSRGMKQE